jgi:hypothetical protein
LPSEPPPEVTPPRLGLDDLCASNSHLHAIRTALHAPKVARLQNALSLFASSVRVAYATAFLEARAALDPNLDSDRALEPIAVAAALRGLALEFVAALTTSTPSRHPHAKSCLDLVTSQLHAVTGPGPEESFPALTPEPVPRGPGALQSFEHATHMCLAALCDGWEVGDCVQMWSQVQHGTFSKSGRTFIPGPRTPQSPGHDWSHTEVRTISRALGEASVSIYVSYGRIVAITSASKLRTRAATRAGTSPPSLHDLPAFIALPRDAEGRPIIPKSRVTALVEAQQAWHQELGPLDSLSSTIVKGLLVMPKIASPSQRKVMRNHPSWEDDPAAQAALGPIIAKWLAQGVLEYVQWDDRQPFLLQPCGAVPKGTAPFYRLITDARYGNKMYSDWGVTYSSAADLSAALQPRDFTWSADLQDAYHLSVFAGCGGALRPCKRPLVQQDGSVSWLDGYIVGCSPDTCLGGCDKDMSGLSISGHVFRFAACQFGQKTAGSPLNSLVMSVARYFARLPDPVHVATWVDDLHFSMRTPDHPPCAGHAAGCPICSKAYERAVAAEALWRRKAQALNLPLSEGKGHSVAQGGPFTGVYVDTLRGSYTMLADKLAALRETFTALVNAETSTPRLLARGRGKAAHYGCAIPHLAAMCPALTQAMHSAEQTFSLPPPTADEEEEDRAFDWDQPLTLSPRARAALRLMLRAVDELGTAGQPIWPMLPAAALGLFREGHTPTAGPVFSALTHVSSHGWGMALRTRPDSAPLILHGPWAPVRALVSAPWMAIPAFSAVGAPLEPAHQHALAALLGTTAAAQQLPLSNTTLVIRIPHATTVSALRHGSSNDPSLHDISMLFSTACMDLHLPRPLLLTAPARDFPQPLSPAANRVALVDSATPRLLVLVNDLGLQAGARITIDLFATSENAQCERFFSATPEALASGTDALQQDSWSSSPCPWCNRRRPDFVLLFPPVHLIRQAVRRAQLDRAHGIAILPCSHTAPWWQTAMAASRSSVRHFQPFHRISCSHTNLAHRSSPGGHHLAVFHFDFWRGDSPRPRACHHGHLRRPPDPAAVSADTADCQAIHDAWLHSLE